MKSLYFIKYVFGIAAILCFSCTSLSQLKVEKFQLSGQLEQDERYNALKISGHEYVMLAKTKGGQSGDSEYLLEKYDIDLNNIWEANLELGDDEDIYKMVHHDNKEVVLFIVDHDEKNEESILKIKAYDDKTGELKFKKELQRFKVNPWQDAFGKGAVKETFIEAIASCATRNFVIPLQYRFHIKYSPDSSKFISYIYDYGQRNLLAEAKIFDKDYNELQSGTVPIDDSFINHGLFLNNRGDVFILNANRGGRIAVIQYQLEGKMAKFLDLQTASQYRDNLRLEILNNDQIYVANLNKRDGELVGLTYTKFNFETQLVDKIVYHEISREYQMGISEARASMGMEKEKDWNHFTITDFYLSPREKVVFILEKRYISSPDFDYNSTATHHVNRWSPKEGTVTTGTVLMFAFNKNDDLMWQNFVAKQQDVGMLDGIHSASFIVNMDIPDRIRFVFASPTNVGMLQDLEIAEYDIDTGEQIRRLHLKNEENLVFMRNYSLWFDKFDEDYEYQGSFLITVGKKGLLGNKTYLAEYKL